MKYIKYLGGFLLLTIICLPLLSQTKERWKDVNNEIYQRPWWRRFIS